MWHCNREGSRPRWLDRLCGAVIFTTIHEEKDKSAVGAKSGKLIYMGTDVRACAKQRQQHHTRAF
jgi:hypothetical protein